MATIEAIEALLDRKLAPIVADINTLKDDVTVMKGDINTLKQNVTQLSRKSDIS
jgi:polyhydroxyalkanoate synthesis regulator phasin